MMSMGRKAGEQGKLPGVIVTSSCTMMLKDTSWRYHAWTELLVAKLLRSKTAVGASTSIAAVLVWKGREHH